MIETAHASEMVQQIYYTVCYDNMQACCVSFAFCGNPETL